MEMGSPVRVLFVIDHFSSPYAGTEGQLLQLISNLPADRFVPELLVLRSSDYVYEGNIPCKVHVLGSSKLFSMKTWLALFEFARRQKRAGTALCHVFFNDSSVLCPPVFGLVGIPTLISRRDMGYWYTRKYLWVLRRTAGFVRGVVANSEAVKRITVQKEGFSDEDVSVIYNGYPEGDEELHPLTGEERQRYVETLGLPKSGRFVVLVANLRDIKRIGDAISALARLNQTLPDTHLVLIGAGDQKPYRMLAEAAGIAGQVHFLGARSDVKNLLRVMDVGLLCSESEGYSNAIVEYMQARLPVVASDVGGNSEAVEHGVTGFLFPMGDVDQMAEQLATVLNGESRAVASMGEAGYKRAGHRHALHTMIEAHCGLYDRLLSGSDYSRSELGVR